MTTPTPLPPPQGVMAPKVGDRVTHILGTDYDDGCISPGDSGTVTATDDDGVQVKWDNPASDYCDGTWWICAASLKPYERTYSEAEYSALLARCEGLEARLALYTKAVNEIDDRMEYRRVDHDFLVQTFAKLTAGLAATRTTGD